MQFLQQKVLYTEDSREISHKCARIAVKNNKILATTFNDEKFFTVRRIIIYSISILDFQRILWVPLKSYS